MAIIFYKTCVESKICWID